MRRPLASNVQGKQVIDNLHSLPLRQQIVSRFDTMSPLLQAAARYILQNPEEVALLSMREVARKAGLKPATMTRFAKFMGLEGYSDLRQLYQEAIRTPDHGFAGKARHQIESQSLEGDSALVTRILGKLADQISSLSQPQSVACIVAAVDRLATARKIYCLGARSCHPASWYFHYITSLVESRAVLLDGYGAVGTDPLIGANADDVLLICSFDPYAKRSFEIAEHCKRMGLTIISITDSEVSPVKALSDVSILASAESLTFFHTMTPAFAIGEILASVLAGRNGERTMDMLGQADNHLRELDVYLKPVVQRP
ncbi:MAG: MurR/RpiR family transcriptional regulator [Pararhodobacter sp.]|nr:MurR/RpiR family transcriptional regulator [Pararhodobacter sp.]